MGMLQTTQQLQTQIDTLHREQVIIQTRCERHEQLFSSIDTKIDLMREELLLITAPLRVLRFLVLGALRLPK